MDQGGNLDSEMDRRAEECAVSLASVTTAAAAAFIERASFDRCRNETSEVTIDERSRVNPDRVVFELVQDETPDSFCRRFVSDNLIQLKNYEKASRFGFIMEAWSKKDSEPMEIRSFIRLAEPFSHVELKFSYLKNARFATANGCYGIRGLTPAWDSAIWGLLKEIEMVPYSNPFSFPSCARLGSVIRSMEFRSEASEACRAVARATAAAQYAISLLYGYERSASLPRYLRCLTDELHDLHERIRNMSFMPSLRITARDLEFMQRILPEYICRQIGRGFAHELCLTDEYYDCVEVNMEMIYDRFCSCRECGQRRFDRYARVQNTRVGVNRRRAHGAKRVPYFEDNYVQVAAYPALGVLRLPRVRHMDKLQQALTCRYLSCDLMYDLHFGSCSAVGHTQGVPLAFSAVSDMDIDVAYGLYLTSNVYFLCFLIRCVRDVIRTEQREYVQYVRGLVRDAADAIRAGVHARTKVDENDYHETEASAEERELSVADAFDKLTFEDESGGFDEDDGFNGAGRSMEPAYRRDMNGFCRDVATFIDLVDSFHVPRALRENRARRDLLLHTFHIKRMYSDRPLSRYYGDRLVPYHIFVGGYRRRDGAGIRLGGVTLSDREIARGHWRRGELSTARLRHYDPFDTMEILRNVCIKKETFMMELEKLYVPRRVIQCLAESVTAGAGDERPSDDRSAETTVAVDSDTASSSAAPDSQDEDAEFVIEHV